VDGLFGITLDAGEEVDEVAGGASGISAITNNQLTISS
jgi:hypothetical protein